MFIKRNKVNAILVTVMMVSVFLTCFCGPAQAELWEYPFVYTVNDGEAQILLYYTESREQREVIIPDTIGGYPVTSIINGCFSNMSGCITSITLPKGVSHTGSFLGQYALSEVIIPNSVTTIDDNAFSGCSKIFIMDIPENVKSIGDEAFALCSGLMGFTGGQGVTMIGDAAFRGCAGLRDYEIPKGVTTIGDETFFGCTSMRSITIPKGITSIGKDAFYHSGLNTITFESPETEIYDSKDTIPEETKIIGYPSSTAEDYAKKYNREFQDINDTGDKSGSDSAKVMIGAIVLLGVLCLGLSIKLAAVIKQNKELVNGNTVEVGETTVEEPLS
mgnify:CR=1 FL=1